MGLDTVPPVESPRLVIDRGPAVISKAFGQYLEAKGMGHILASPYHPRTDGETKRYDSALKETVSLLVWEPSDGLRSQIGEFTEQYNSHSYREALDNVIPNDVYYGQ